MLFRTIVRIAEHIGEKQAPDNIRMANKVAEASPTPER